MSIILNSERIGNFTSSKIAALMTNDRSGKGFGKPALTYIEEKNMERRLGRSLTEEINARPTTWGKMCETIIFSLLSLAYVLSSNKTIKHPLLPWSGSPDGEKGDDTVMDIKCPFTLKSFCQLVHALYLGFTGIEAIKYIRENHPDGETYYWQLVSNAILTGKRFAELIVYCPYQSELEVIRTYCEGDKRAYWIWSSEDTELPYLIEGGYYQNINIIRFEVPEEDKIALITRVTEAAKMLHGYDIPQGELKEFNPSLLKKI